MMKTSMLRCEGWDQSYTIAHETTHVTPTPHIAPSTTSRLIFLGLVVVVINDGCYL